MIPALAVAVTLAVSTSNYLGPFRLDSSIEDDRLTSLGYTAATGRLWATNARQEWLEWDLPEQELRQPLRRAKPPLMTMIDSEPASSATSTLYDWALLNDRFLWERSTGHRVGPVPNPVPDSDRVSPAYSPCGRFLALGFVRGHGSPTPGPARIPVWDLAGRKLHTIVEVPIPPGGLVTMQIALSAGAKCLAVAIEPSPTRHGDGIELVTIDTTTNKHLHTEVFDEGRDAIRPVAVDATGERLLYRRGERLYFQMKGDERERELRFWPGAHLNPLAVRPDLSEVLVWGPRQPGQNDPRPIVARVEFATLRPRVWYPWEELGVPIAGVLAPHDGGFALLTKRHAWRYREGPPGALPTDPWAALAGSPELAWRTLEQLRTQPDFARRLFQQHLQPSLPREPLDLQKSIARLDAPAYFDREAASAELLARVRFLEPALRSALEVTRSSEVRERLEHILARSDQFSAPEIREIRAIEWLLRDHSPAALAIVRHASRGPADAVLTREALR
ncbi:MAG: hypothetical protein ACRCZF_18325, partial [Gemmataceae bacterium]